jgi:hypothetical protein
MPALFSSTDCTTYYDVWKRLLETDASAVAAPPTLLYALSCTRMAFTDICQMLHCRCTYATALNHNIMVNKSPQVRTRHVSPQHCD